MPIIVEILYTEKRAIYNVTYATIDNKLKRKAHKPSMKPVGDCFFRGSHPNFFSVLELECQPIPMYHHAVDHIKPEPFVAATLSAFTVSRQRWDCDIPTVTLALPSATFDQSVFLSPYLTAISKALLASSAKTIETNRLHLSSPLLRPDLGELAKPDTKMDKTSPCPICTSNLLIFIQS